MGSTASVDVLENECLALRGSNLGPSSPYPSQDGGGCAQWNSAATCTAALLREPQMCFC